MDRLLLKSPRNKNIWYTPQTSTDSSQSFASLETLLLFLMDKSFKDPVNLHPLKVLVGNYKVRNFNHFKTIPDKNFWNYPFLPSFFAKERRNYFLGQVCISLLDHLTILLYIIPQLVLMILHYPLLFNPCSDGIKHGLHKSEWIKPDDQTYFLPLTVLEWCYQCWRLLSYFWSKNIFFFTNLTLSHL